MDRIQLHRELSEYFPNSKDFLVKMLIKRFTEREIINEIQNLKGRKIPVRFRDQHVKELVRKIGVSETEFYNAFLNLLIKEFKDIDGILEEVIRWKKESIIQYV